MPRDNISYLAGLVDADGCFSIGRCRNSFVPRILVVNTNKDIMDWLVSNYGGDVQKSRVKNKPNWKPRYTWRISHKKALLLADKLDDYLVIKRYQSLIFKTWLVIRDIFKPSDRASCYEYLAGEITISNRKGVYAT